ncbi:MAG: hypothetical protein VX609_06720 [Verrucomicrobiota bacterium]|nr:hypothetical protein [Verrucomicrobiota bacterium]
MCKILIVMILLGLSSCTQVVTVPVRSLLDMPTKVERIRTTTTHDISVASDRDAEEI